MQRHRIVIMVAALLLIAGAAAADHRTGKGSGDHRAARDGRHYHDGKRGDIRRFDHRSWQRGEWVHGHYRGRIGWWWVVGPDWFWYPEAVAPWPDPFVPPGGVSGFWYWCEHWQAFYPHVASCPWGWRAIVPY